LSNENELRVTHHQRANHSRDRLMNVVVLPVCRTGSSTVCVCSARYNVQVLMKGEKRKREREYKEQAQAQCKAKVISMKLYLSEWVVPTSYVPVSVIHKLFRISLISPYFLLLSYAYSARLVYIYVHTVYLISLCYCLIHLI